MPLPQLQPRLVGLPLVLAGPLLRRVEATEVTVFLALREARTVTLAVHAADAAGAPTGAARAEGTRATIPLGANLHVVAVTATTPAGAPLPQDVTHVYDVRLGPHGAGDAPVAAGPGLMSPGVVAADAVGARAALTYGPAPAPQLPSFALPGSTATLRVLHTSCRKPHGGGEDDALATADGIVAEAIAAGAPARRPHLLVLTGDQIYADDVADPLLAVCTDAATALLGAGRDELLPTLAGPRVASVHPAGDRARLVADDARLSTDDGDSHLLSFGEFCAMYLATLAPTIWPDSLPAPDDFAPSTRGPFADGRRAEQRRALARFWRALPAVRRALANIPTLTIFDDHEVTDDWNLRASWTARVLDPATGSPLGRRIVQNGLAAYAVFQGWGNTPERFARTGDAGAAGRALLDALAAWDGQSDSGAEITAIRAGVGMPTGLDATGAATRAPGAVDWHYALTAPTHQLVVLDTRTRRASPEGPREPAALMGAAGALAAQLVDVPAPADDVPVLVVSPTPVFGNPLVEWIQSVGEFFGFSEGWDAETWSMQPGHREELVAALAGRGTPDGRGVRRQRVVVLCGDVHYGFTAAADYRATRTPAGAERPASTAIAQLTASPARNRSGMTGFLHGIGYVPITDGVPEARVVGAANAGGGEVVLGTRPGGGEVRGRGTPALAELPPGGTPAATADWHYDLRYLLADTPEAATPPATVPAAPPPGDRAAALAAHLAAAGAHARDYVGRHGDGKEIVGVNTLGEVTFAWGELDTDKRVVHELWWRLPRQPSPFPLSRWSVALGNGSVAGAGLRLMVRPPGGGEAVPLANAWVYVHTGDVATTLVTLRTEADGRLVERAGAVRDAPWDHTRQWTPAAGTQAHIAFTRGARPLPEAVLRRATLAGTYQQAVIPALDPATMRAPVTVDDVRIAVTRPADLDLWPLLWQDPDVPMPWLVAGAGGIDPDGRTHETAGLPQRARAWNNPGVDAGNLTVVDGAPAAAPGPAALRPRALRVEATVPADAVDARVELFRADGATVRTRPDLAPATAARDDAPATLAAAAGGTRALTVDLVIDPDAVAAALGHVQVLITCTTPAGPRIEACAPLLMGVQTALVEDPDAATRGPVVGEAADVLVVDFGATENPDGTWTPASPAANSAALAAATRVRRMRRIRGPVVTQALDPALPVAVPANPVVPKPLMPRLMAELHLAGLDRARLVDLMRRRWFRREADPATERPAPLLELTVEADWEMVTTWQGPDAAGMAPRAHLRHQHRTASAGTSRVLMRFNAEGLPCDANGVALTIPADGVVPDAMPPVAAPAWMEAGRRAAGMTVAAQRPWGRAGGAPPVPTTVIEWLPLFPRMRGGDGRLDLTELRIGRELVAPAAIHRGRVPGAAATDLAAPPAGRPLARLPRVRITGTNPDDAQRDALAAALTAKRLAELRAGGSAAVAMLADAAWLGTLNLFIAHESGPFGHYDTRPPARRQVAGRYYVGERDMPTFGGPNGYGLLQLDNWGAAPGTGATPDMVWSFVDNIQQGVELMLVEKANGAHGTLNAHPPAAGADAAALHRFRATFQREVVRRYNGGTEFRWDAGAWRIRPSEAIAGPNVTYPNAVLGTGVNYGTFRVQQPNAAGVMVWVRTGAAVGPIDFPAAQFGPGSDLDPAPAAPPGP